MIVIGNRAASSNARELFPAAVGPLMTGMNECSSTAKAALELIPGQMHDGGPAMNVVGGQLCAREGNEQRAHLADRHDVARFDRCLASNRRRETLMTRRCGGFAVSSQRGERLAQATFGVEARVRHRDAS